MKKVAGKIILLLVAEFCLDTVILALLIAEFHPAPLVHLVVFKSLSVVTILVLNHLIIAQPIALRRLRPRAWVVAVLWVGLLAVIGGLHPQHLQEAVVVGVIAAVPEELLFRGVILGALFDAFASSRRRVVAPLLLSAAIFGGAHLINLQTQSLAATVMQMLQAMGLGLLLGALYLRTQNLVFPLLGHFTLDFGVTLASGFAAASGQTPGYGVSLAIGALYALLAVLVLWHQQLPQQMARRT